MIFISWNCRGIQNSSCLRHSKEIMRVYKPDFFFLMEIRCNDVVVAQAFGRKLGFDSLAFEPSQGMAGGLVVYWRSGAPRVHLLVSSSQFLHLQITEGQVQSIVTCVYVRPHAILKDAFWEQLQQMAVSITDPWFVMGDFNDIALASEKSGGAAFAFNRAKKFTDRWDACRLSDLGASGTKFTWV